MKKNLLIISLIFAMFTTFAQEVQTENNNGNATPEYTGSMDSSSFCPHRINFNVGEAFTNNIYKRVDITQYYSMSTMLDASYAYFFNQHWGISLGVGLNRIVAKASISKSGMIPNFGVNYDPYFDDYTTVNPTYDLYYTATGLREKQTVWAIEVPLMAQFEWKFDGRNGIYAGLGVQGYFPFSASNTLSGEGVISTTGYEALYNQLYGQYYENSDLLMTNHFGNSTYNGKSKSVKMRCSVDVLGDFGGVFAMGRKADLYVGVYAKYGFLDILPKDANKTSIISMSESKLYYNGTLGSDILNGAKETEEYKNISTKWNLLQVGLKVGVHLKPCCSPAEKSRKQIEKEILEELKKKANDPIIIKQDPQYIYIVPVCDQLDQDDNGLTAEDKENIRQLADALSKTKILFDLDMDTPKIADENDNIDKTVQILKKDPSLKLIVEGYTCDLGTEQHNRDLAQRRADKVRDLFIQKGVPAGQIETATYTTNDPQNHQNIQDPRREEHRAAIFRIVKR